MKLKKLAAVLIAAAMALTANITVSAEEDPSVTADRTVAKNELTRAINDAYVAKEGVTASELFVKINGKYVLPAAVKDTLPKMEAYVPSSVMKAFETAIKDAEKVRDKVSSKTPVEDIRKATRVFYGDPYADQSTQEYLGQIGVFVSSIDYGTNTILIGKHIVELGRAIEEAEALQKDVTKITSGKMTAGKKYAPQAAKDELDISIKNAAAVYAARDNSRNQAAATNRLKSAVTLFNTYVVTGTSDTSGTSGSNDPNPALINEPKLKLGVAIEDAKALQKAVASSSGKTSSDFEPGKKYAPQAALDALKDSVTAAEKVYKDSKSTSSNYTETLAALNSALTVFNGYVQTGSTQPATSGSGGGGISPSAVKPSFVKSEDIPKTRGLNKMMLPANSLAVTANVQGALNGTVPFKVTADDLKKAGIAYSKVQLYSVSDNGSVKAESGKIVKDSDGGITVNFTDFLSNYVLAEYNPPVLCDLKFAGDALKAYSNDNGMTANIEKYDFDYDGRLTIKDVSGIMRAYLN